MGLGKIVVVFALLLSTYVSYGQSFSELEEKKATIISPGFNYHLQIFQIDVSPVFTIKTLHRLQPGFGLNYLYYYRNPRKGESSVGANVFSRFFFSRHIFLHGEYLFCNVPKLNQFNNEYSRTQKGDFFFGGGYQQPLTDKVDSYLTLLINLNNKPDSAYKNLILFRAGISF